MHYRLNIKGILPNVQTDRYSVTTIRDRYKKLVRKIIFVSVRFIFEH